MSIDIQIRQISEDKPFVSAPQPFRYESGFEMVLTIDPDGDHVLSRFLNCLEPIDCEWLFSEFQRFVALDDVVKDGCKIHLILTRGSLADVGVFAWKIRNMTMSDVADGLNWANGRINSYTWVFGKMVTALQESEARYRELELRYERLKLEGRRR